MKKFLVYSFGRCGSTLFAQQITKAMELVGSDVCWHTDNGDIDWSMPVHHTHKPEMLSDAPNDFIRVHVTRSLVDSGISKMIADLTGYYHVFSSEDQETYFENFKNTKFKIDIDRFKNYTVGINHHLQKANALFDQIPGEKYKLDYNTYSNNVDLLYKTLGLTANPEPDNILVCQKMPIDKFDLIENLQELVDAIKSLPVDLDQDDQIAIDNLQKRCQINVADFC